MSPRLYVIAASDAPIAAVFRRGPTEWWHVGRWNLDDGSYEPGAWLHGRLYPRRCDLSPDGGLLLAYVRKEAHAGFLGAGYESPDTYITISRLPWLSALAAWREGSTWGAGYRFTTEPSAIGKSILGDPDFGERPPVLKRYGIERYEVVQYAVERHRGWVERADSPPRSADDMWDQRRQAILTKPRPNGRQANLILRDQGLSTSGAIEYRAPLFWLSRGSDEELLDDVVWADWTPNGRLAVATNTGTLQLRDADSLQLVAVSEHALARLQPDPQPAPDWAQTWSQRSSSKGHKR